MNNTYKISASLVMMSLLAMGMTPTASAGSDDREVINLTGLDLGAFGSEDLNYVLVDGEKVDLTDLVDVACRPYVDCLIDAILKFCNNAAACQIVISLANYLIWLTFDTYRAVMILVGDVIDIVETVCNDVSSLCPLLAKATQPIEVAAN